MSRPVVVLAMHPVFTAGMLQPRHLEQLRACCDLPDPEPLSDLGDERALALLPRAEILLTAWGCPPLTGEVLDRAPGLRAVIHASGTVKNHVTPACFERRVRVTSAAAANAKPVAEFALATILLASKRAFRLQRLYREIRNYRLWSREVPDPSNFNKIVGIVGASHIGRRVVELLRPFDLSCLLYDPTLSDEAVRALGAEPVTLDELLERADVVSLHAPALESTRHMLDARGLARMRDGSVLVNTARGHLVDGEALTRELVSGRIDAVLDTTDPEILPKDSPLYELDNVFLTPHIAGALGTERERMVDLAVEEIERLVRGDALQYEVRAEDWERIA